MLIVTLAVCALVCFVLAALPRVSTPLNLVPLDLALLTIAFLLGHA